jgi:hypothetical protein
MSDLGDIHHFLGINVHRTHDGLFFYLNNSMPWKFWSVQRC